jgi:hypothetical protein
MPFPSIENIEKSISHHNYTIIPRMKICDEVCFSNYMCTEYREYGDWDNSDNIDYALQQIKLKKSFIFHITFYDSDSIEYLRPICENAKIQSIEFDQCKIDDEILKILYRCNSIKSITFNRCELKSYTPYPELKPKNLRLLKLKDINGPYSLPNVLIRYLIIENCNYFKLHAKDIDHFYFYDDRNEKNPIRVIFHYGKFMISNKEIISPGKNIVSINDKTITKNTGLFNVMKKSVRKWFFQ